MFSVHLTLLVIPAGRAVWKRRRNIADASLNRCWQKRRKTSKEKKNSVRKEEAGKEGSAKKHWYWQYWSREGLHESGCAYYEHGKRTLYIYGDIVVSISLLLKIYLECIICSIYLIDLLVLPY